VVAVVPLVVPLAVAVVLLAVLPAVLPAVAEEARRAPGVVPKLPLYVSADELACLDFMTDLNLRRNPIVTPVSSLHALRKTCWSPAT
jgi:hypothetical protein